MAVKTKETKVPIEQGTKRFSDLTDDELMALAQVNEVALGRELVKQSFYQFILEFWDEIIPEKFIYNWHIEYLANELQELAERVFLGLPRLHDLIINVSPGTTKSTLASIMFPGWVWTRMPTARFIGASYASALSMDHSRRTRDLVTCEKYRLWFPEINLRWDQAAKSYFMNRQGGSRFSTGVGSAVVTGMHGHFLVVDDPLNPNEAVSELELKSANRWMSETLPTRKVDKELVPTILIMQRLHQDDPAQNMLDRADDENKVRWICLPAEETEDIHPVELRNYYEDGLMDPVRLSRRVLNENRKALLEFGYAGQFLQRPVPLGGGMFKAGRIVVDTAPDKWRQRVRYWDKAASHDSGAYTVGALLGEDVEHRWWILDIVRGQWATNEREKRIKQTAQMDGRRIRVWIEQEPGSGGKDSAEWTIRNLAGYRVKADPVGRAEGNKALRAEPFSTQVNGGNVYMVRAEWNKELIGELTYFPYSKYKDQVDALSGAFNAMTKKKIRVGGAW
jgi:predicted phage terminase large subunit-like protein